MKSKLTLLVIFTIITGMLLSNAAFAKNLFHDNEIIINEYLELKKLKHKSDIGLTP